MSRSRWPTPSSLDWGGPNGPGPQTENAKERGFDRDVEDENLGEADSFDDDQTGDIADEGPGHRG